MAPEIIKGSLKTPWTFTSYKSLALIGLNEIMKVMDIVWLFTIYADETSLHITHFCICIATEIEHVTVI